MNTREIYMSLKLAIVIMMLLSLWSIEGYVRRTQEDVARIARFAETSYNQRETK